MSESARKPFDQALLDECDPMGRAAVKGFFMQMKGITLIDNPDKYGVDLCLDDGTPRAEVETRKVWTEKKFPFSTINFPYRKVKFLQHTEVAYIIVSADGKRIGGIAGLLLKQVISTMKPQENRNKYVEQGELFYPIPAHYFYFYELEWNEDALAEAWRCSV